MLKVKIKNSKHYYSLVLNRKVIGHVRAEVIEQFKLWSKQ